MSGIHANCRRAGPFASVEAAREDRARTFMWNHAALPSVNDPGGVVAGKGDLPPRRISGNDDADRGRI